MANKRQATNTSAATWQGMALPSGLRKLDAAETAKVMKEYGAGSQVKIVGKEEVANFLGIGGSTLNRYMRAGVPVNGEADAVDVVPVELYEVVPGAFWMGQPSVEGVNKLRQLFNDGLVKSKGSVSGFPLAVRVPSTAVVQFVNALRGNLSDAETLAALAGVRDTIRISSKSRRDIQGLDDLLDGGADADAETETDDDQ